MISKAKDLYAEAPKLAVLVYGRSGMGKTTWAALAPRPLVLLTERQGLPSIYAANPEALVIEITDWRQFCTVFQALQQATTCTVGGKAACTFHPPGEAEAVVFSTLVVDSLTDLQAMAFSAMAGKDADPLGLEVTDSDFRMYGRLQTVMEHVLREQRAMPCNTVFLALAEDEFSDPEKRLGRQILPMLVGRKLAPKAGQYFNAVGFIDLDGDKRVIRWGARRGFVSKAAPGWPDATINTLEPGQTTLGSLLAYSSHVGTLLLAEGDGAERVLVLEGDEPEKGASTPENAAKRPGRVRGART